MAENASPAEGEGDRRSGGVQSIERLAKLLEIMADAGGEITLSQLAVTSGLPLPTIHRLLRTLAGVGYVRQEADRRYALGPRLIRLGETATRLLSGWAKPCLAHLVEVLGETANLAVLDGDQVVYVSQVPSRHSMRMFTEVGRRVPVHCTGVGKALLAQIPENRAIGILSRSGMPAQTEHTITSPTAMLEHLKEVRRLGYAIDEGEQEIGVRCLATHIPDTVVQAAISISGPATRITDDLISRAIPVLSETARQLSVAFNEVKPGP
jgi:IclR family acetate operon transcriptional repressor